MFHFVRRSISCEHARSTALCWYPIVDFSSSCVEHQDAIKQVVIFFINLLLSESAFIISQSFILIAICVGDKFVITQSVTKLENSFVSKAASICLLWTQFSGN